MSANISEPEETGYFHMKDEKSLVAFGESLRDKTTPRVVSGVSISTAGGITRQGIFHVASRTISLIVLYRRYFYKNHELGKEVSRGVCFIPRIDDVAKQQQQLHHVLLDVSLLSRENL